MEGVLKKDKPIRKEEHLCPHQQVYRETMGWFQQPRDPLKTLPLYDKPEPIAGFYVSNLYARKTLAYIICFCKYFHFIIDNYQSQAKLIDRYLFLS